jgi:hypothetical protein
MIRLIQTTLASETTENGIATIFLRNTKDITTNSGVYRITLFSLEALGVNHIIYLPEIATPSGKFPYIDHQWLARLFLGDYEGGYEGIDIDLIKSVLTEAVIVAEQSPPSLKSLFDFLKDASGVSIGAWVGIAAAVGVGNPMLMFITVPAGMLIVGTAKGIATAIERGLVERLVEGTKEGGRDSGA